MKKPRIRYKVKKIRLDAILQNVNIDKCFIEIYISNAHQISFHISHFIRAYIIFLHKENKNFPIIDSQFFKLCYMVLTKKSKGGNSPKGENKNTIEILQKFYDEYYSKLGYKLEDKIDPLHLSQMMDYVATEYQTSIENNVVINFTNYVKRYVNSSFITKFKHNIENITEDKFSEFKNLEVEYLNLVFPIIEELINKINCLLKNKYYNNKNATKKELVFLEKNKQKYLNKYKSICKKLKISPNAFLKNEYPNVNLDEVKNDIKLINNINQSFIENAKEIKTNGNYRRKNKDEELKILKNELYKVKNDLIENTNTADPKYNNFIESFRKNILPKYDTTKFSLLEYLKEDPQSFIKSLIIMVENLEKNNYKTFQFLPLYASSIQRSVKIDTKILVEIFINENKNEYLNNITKKQQEIWSDLFKINSKIFKLSKSSPYVFDHSIVTNGYTASIIFIHKDDKMQKTKFQNLGKDKRKINADLLKELDEENKKIFKQKQEEKAKEEKIKKSVEINKKAKEKKENFKKLTKEQQIKIKEENKRKNNDFLYIDELNEDELKEISLKLRKNKVITIDPGKKNLIFAQDDKKNTLRYSNKEHLKRTKRLEYAEKLKNLKSLNGISDEENKLSNYNAKTINFEDFCKYIKNKIEVNNTIKDKYKNIKFRQYKWYSYINNERAEATLMNKLRNKFGEDIIIFYGDWSIGKQMANFISTPNLKLKRKISEHFKVYNLDEYNTSKLSSVTLEECENLTLKDKFGTPRELHSVLTYKKEIEALECNLGEQKKYIMCNINRDKNSSTNMIFIVKYYLKHKSFPKEFTRSENKELNSETLKIADKILSIFENLKKANINIETTKIEELKKSLKFEIKEEDYELLYLIKNCVSNKRTIIPENVKEKSNKNIMKTSKKILGEIKNGKEKIISKYENKEKLKVHYEENFKKSCGTCQKSQITGSLKDQLHEDKILTKLKH